VERTPVESSNIQSVGYSEETQTLEVEFKGGNVYQYFDVPTSVHLSLMQADSLGVFFSSAIRGVYRFARV
jgi:hypothetical protein